MSGSESDFDLAAAVLQPFKSLDIISFCVIIPLVHTDKKFQQLRRAEFYILHRDLDPGEKL